MVSGLRFLCLSRDRREAERKLEDLKKNRSIAFGRQKGFEEEILQYRWDKNLWFHFDVCYSNKLLSEADQRHTDLLW